jgi:hypothetical protein
MELKFDPERMKEKEKWEGTGIYIRAQDEEGRWHSEDIALLDMPSLLEWLRSRGGYNPWAEDVVGILLGHGHIAHRKKHEVGDEERKIVKFWKDGEVRYYGKEIDEIVCSCKHFHLEDLGENGMWMGIYRNPEEEGAGEHDMIHVNMGAKERIKIFAEVEDEEHEG